jgi:hypothetical protein
MLILKLTYEIYLPGIVASYFNLLANCSVDVQLVAQALVLV